MSVSDPTDLVAWLNACYDRAERRARAATDGPWRVAECGEVETVTAYGTPGYESPLHVTCDNSGGAPSVGEEDAEFIAGLDPAWRLADIGRKRLILAEHDPEDAGGGRLRCTVCADPPQYDARWRGWPCLTVRLLAEEFASEPGYDAQRWAP